MILVTGCAGFIGMHICETLLQQGYDVLGIDNLNDYYDVNLKNERLNILKTYCNFIYEKIDLKNLIDLKNITEKHNKITYIIHLAAQAGVRYSIINPHSYIDNNITGHLNILEMSRNLPLLKHIVYASTSSVYGSNTKLPFAESDRTDNPISVYAASKKSCELLSDVYSKSYKIRMTGLRYFTVYGPWGRPDMALFSFTKAIINNQPIPVYNNGLMERNFTFIDDIVKGTINCLFKEEKNEFHKIYNIGNKKSETLIDYIKTIEKHIGKTAQIDFQPLQQGDVVTTQADIQEAKNDFNFDPQTDIDEGVKSFIDWYLSFYKE